jgi:hypothetical protein
MDEEMIGQPILGAKRHAIENRIVRIAGTGINVVRGQDNLLSQQLVVEHQQGSIKPLDSVVPKDVKDWGLSRRGVADEPDVIPRKPVDLGSYTRTRTLVATQVEEVYLRAAMEGRAVQLIVADNVQAHLSAHQRIGQPKRIRLVTTAGKQGDGEILRDDIIGRW